MTIFDQENFLINLSVTRMWEKYYHIIIFLECGGVLLKEEDIVLLEHQWRNSGGTVFATTMPMQQIFSIKDFT